MSFATRRSRPQQAEREFTPSDTREAALRLLERTRRTRNELARRLREGGHQATEVEPVLDRLTEVGLIDDVEYARAFLAGRWGRKPTGWRRLEMELKKRGVGSEDIAKARGLLEASDGGGGGEVAAACKVIDQSSRRYASLDPRTRRQRLFALLMRRGFNGDIIKQALKAASSEMS